MSSEASHAILPISRSHPELGFVNKVEHYDAIDRDIESGALRQPAYPMTDSELAAAIAELVATTPSDTSRASLNRRFNPSEK
jgi:hypothetical protein